MGPSQDSLVRGWRWVSRVLVPIVLVLVVAEGAMRLAEPRFDQFDAALNRGDVPVLKLRAVGDVLGDGGTLFIGASDAESAFIPAQVMAAAGFDEPGYNASVPGMPTDMYGTWARHVETAGGDPDRIVVGVNPTQFQPLTIDGSLTEQEAGVSIDEFVESGLARVRSNIERAPQYAGVGDGLVDRIALLRSRQWIQHPTDAWQALTGDEPPHVLEAHGGLTADEVDADLRPDGTSARRDAPTTAGQPARVTVDGSVLGPADEEAMEDWIDDLRRLRDDTGAEINVVLLPFTPQLTGVAADPDFIAAQASMLDKLCAEEMATLDLTPIDLPPDAFSDQLHFSSIGAERLSGLTGTWLGEGAPTTCGVTG